MEIKKIENCFEVRGFYTAFRFDWDADFVFSGERHEMWEAVFLTGGRVEITEDENIYTLSAGELVFHAPMEFHRIRAAEGSSPSGYIMSFTVSGEMPANLKNGVFRLSPHEAEEYGNLCRKILAFFDGEAASPYAGQEAGMLFSAFLIGLCTVGETAPTPLNAPSAQAYRRLIAELTAAAEVGRSLAEVAQACYISTSYLKTLIRKYAGISPKDYYTRLRLQHAMRLLREGASAGEVAERMNFSSQNYFAVFFKKHTGKSPSAFKKSISY